MKKGRKEERRGTLKSEQKCNSCSKGLCCSVLKVSERITNTRKPANSISLTDSSV